MVYGYSDDAPSAIAGNRVNRECYMQVHSGGTQTLDIDSRARGNGEHSNWNEHPGEFERVYGPYKILTNQCFVFIFYNLKESLFVMWQKLTMSSTSSQVTFCLSCFLNGTNCKIL